MLLSAEVITYFLLALAILLGTARLLGEIARRFGQPSVLGEIFAGVLLGPTLLGRMAPELQGTLFPTEGNAAVLLEGFFALAVTLFLLVAGMEVDLSLAFRRGKVALKVSLLGMALPFALGFAFAWFLPGVLGGLYEGTLLNFALFFATALSISALPVIAKILKDMNLIKTDLGVIVLASAIVNDIVGWIVFAVVLGMMGQEKGLPIEQVIGLTLAFVVFMLTVGRWAVHRLLPFLQAHASWPAGVLGFALVGALGCAALTEFIGIHAIFGAFIFGVALGDSPHLKERTRSTLDQFISCIFAPLFFASIGLKVDFIGNFDFLAVSAVLILAIVGKTLGCYWGARLSKMPDREAWAVGFASNARGAMEIILGLLALQYNLIGETLFVALVVMALVTSMMSGSLIEWVLKRGKAVDFASFLKTAWFRKPLEATDAKEAIEELAALLAPDANFSAEAIASAAWQREQSLPTGLPNRIAIPHARLEGLKAPMIAIGISPQGIEFDAPDGRRARLIFLILTPQQDNGAQLEILAAIAGIGGAQNFPDTLIGSGTFTEFLAHLRARESGH